MHYIVDSEVVMGDQEFLNYCDSHSETQRCGFVPEQIARLAQLAGKPGIAEIWDEKPFRVYEMDGDEIREFVDQARTRLTTQPTA